MPPQVLDAMRRSDRDYSYINELQTALDAIPTEYYDFLSPQPITEDNLDFQDGMHGSQLLYDKILLAIVETNPKSALAPYIDKAWLQQDIRQLTRNPAPP